MVLVDTRRVGKLGRLGIPENIRTRLRMYPGTEVNLYIQGPSLVVTPVGKASSCCGLCGEPCVDGITVSNKCVCNDCRAKITGVDEA